jgi:hypothetical protein
VNLASLIGQAPGDPGQTRESARESSKSSPPVPESSRADPRACPGNASSVPSLSPRVPRQSRESPPPDAESSPPVPELSPVSVGAFPVILRVFAVTLPGLPHHALSLPGHGQVCPWRLLTRMTEGADLRSSHNGGPRVKFMNHAAGRRSLGTLVARADRQDCLSSTVVRLIGSELRTADVHRTVERTPPHPAGPLVFCQPFLLFRRSSKLPRAGAQLPLPLQGRGATKAPNLVLREMLASARCPSPLRRGEGCSAPAFGEPATRPGLKTPGRRPGAGPGEGSCLER